jgi:hypothetical protein
VTFGAIKGMSRRASPRTGTALKACPSVTSTEGLEMKATRLLNCRESSPMRARVTLSESGEMTPARPLSLRDGSEGRSKPRLTFPDSGESR